jgi:hypothetical protein
VTRKLTIDPGRIVDDAPLRLDAAGLRREAAKGRLIIERIAGKDYVTKRALNNYRLAPVGSCF